MTITPVLPTTGIYWNSTVVKFTSGSTVACCSAASNSALHLLVNGLPESTASVTLSTPAGDIPYIYGGTQLGCAEYHPNSYSPLPYQPGGTYILTAITSIGTSSASGILPGVTAALSADHLTASWTVPGNADYVQVFNNTTYLFPFYTPGPVALSPLSIPASAYATSGSYSVMMVLVNKIAVTGATAGSFLSLINEKDFGFSVP